MLSGVDEEIHISIVIIVRVPWVLGGRDWWQWTGLGARACVTLPPLRAPPARRQGLPPTSQPADQPPQRPWPPHPLLTTCLQVSAVFVVYAVVDAIIYENTLELVTSVLLGARAPRGVGCGGVQPATSVPLGGCTVRTGCGWVGDADAQWKAADGGACRSFRPPVPAVAAQPTRRCCPAHPPPGPSPRADTLVVARVLWFASQGTANSTFKWIWAVIMLVFQAIYIVRRWLDPQVWTGGARTAQSSAAQLACRGAGLGWPAASPTSPPHMHPRPPTHARPAAQNRCLRC